MIRLKPGEPLEEHSVLIDRRVSVAPMMDWTDKAVASFWINHLRSKRRLRLLYVACSSPRTVRRELRVSQPTIAPLIAPPGTAPMDGAPLRPVDGAARSTPCIDGGRVDHCRVYTQMPEQLLDARQVRAALY